MYIVDSKTSTECWSHSVLKLQNGYQLMEFIGHSCDLNSDFWLDPFFVSEFTKVTKASRAPDTPNKKLSKSCCCFYCMSKQRICYATWTTRNRTRQCQFWTWAKLYMALGWWITLCTGQFTSYPVYSVVRIMLRFWEKCTSTDKNLKG